MTTSVYPNQPTDFDDVPVIQGSEPDHRTNHNEERAALNAITAKLGGTQGFKGIERFSNDSARDTQLTTPSVGMACSVGSTTMHNQTGQPSGWQVLGEPAKAFTLSISQGVALGFNTDRAVVRRFGGGAWMANIVATFTSIGTANVAITINLPFTLANPNDIGGTWSYFDPGNTNYAGAIRPNTTTSVVLIRSGFGNNFGAGDQQVGSGDVLVAQLIAN